MTTWTYIAQSLPWIAVGLLVGWFMGRSTVAVQTIADAVQEVGPMTATEQSDLEPAEEPPRRRRFTAMHILGLIVLVLGVFTAIQGYVQSQATERLAICHQTYSNAFADALEARTASSLAATQALDDFLTAVSTATPTPAGRDKIRQALTDYLRKRAEAKKAQAEHPYPPAPREICH